MIAFTYTECATRSQGQIARESLQEHPAPVALQDLGQQVEIPDNLKVLVQVEFDIRLESGENETAAPSLALPVGNWTT